MKKISEVSKLAGVSRRTLQYYDDLGILGIKRSESNYRMYDETAMQHLWEIMLYKELGLELKSIKTLLELSEKEAKEYLQEHIQRVDRQICGLQEQIRFAVWILKYGTPQAPPENGVRSYAAEIAELKRLMKES